MNIQYENACLSIAKKAYTIIITYNLGLNHLFLVHDFLCPFQQKLSSIMKSRE